MKILFIVPYAPNLIRVRPYNLIRYLNRGSHRVTLLTLVCEAWENKSLEQLTKEGIQVKAFPLSKMRSLFNCALGLPGHDPLQSHYCWQPQMAESALSLIRNATDMDPFDVIHIEHLRGVRYGIWLKEQFKKYPDESFPPIVWDSVDSISYLFRQASGQSRKFTSRIISWLDLKRTESLESRMVGFFERMTVTSPVDQKAFLDLAPAKKDLSNISVVPNGVDLDYFKPDPNVERERTMLVVSGKMSYHANVTMVTRLVNDIMPLLWQRKPETGVWIVGKDPSVEVLELGKDSRIKVTGTVSDIRPYLRKGYVALAPISYGSGIQNKVLEAMACGTPVITTRQAISALFARPGEDLLVAENPEQFAQAVFELLEDPQRWHQLSEAGFRYVNTFHKWGRIVENLVEIYRDINSPGLSVN